MAMALSRRPCRRLQVLQQPFAQKPATVRIAGHNGASASLMCRSDLGRGPQGVAILLWRLAGVLPKAASEMRLVEKAQTCSYVDERCFLLDREKSQRVMNSRALNEPLWRNAHVVGENALYRTFAELQTIL